MENEGVLQSICQACWGTSSMENTSLRGFITSLWAGAK